MTSSNLTYCILKITFAALMFLLHAFILLRYFSSSLVLVCVGRFITEFSVFLHLGSCFHVDISCKSSVCRVFESQTLCVSLLLHVYVYVRCLGLFLLASVSLCLSSPVCTSMSASIICQSWRTYWFSHRMIFLCNI